MTFVVTMKRLVTRAVPPPAITDIDPVETRSVSDRWGDPTLELRREFLVRWDDESDSRPATAVPRAAAGRIAPMAPIRARTPVGAGFHHARACRGVR